MIHSPPDGTRHLGLRTSALTGTSRQAKFFVLLPCVVGATIGLLLQISPWIALACTLTIIITVVALMRPVFLCYLTIMAVALTSGMERGKPIPFLRTNEVVLVLSAVIALVIILTRKNRYPVHFGGLGTAIFVLVLGTSMIPGAYYLVRGTNLTVPDAIVLLAPFQYVLLFWLFAYLPSNNQERLGIIKFMLFCGLIVAMVGLLQAAKIGFVTDFLNNWYSSSHQETAVQQYRITSLMAAWNGLGIFMMFNLMIIWAFGISRPSDLGWRAILVEGAACISCLILSGSFAGFAGLILGIAIITMLLGVYFSKRNIILFLVTVSVITFTFLLFRENILGRLDEQWGYGGMMPSTLSTRFKLWEDIYLPAIQQNLLWGINPTVPASYSWTYTESQFLTLLFSSGLIGFSSYLLWNIIILNSLIRRFDRHDSFLRTVSAIAISIIVVLFIAGFTNAVSTYSGTADYLWIILALITSGEGLKPRHSA